MPINPDPFLVHGVGHKFNGVFPADQAHADASINKARRAAKLNLGDREGAQHEPSKASEKQKGDNDNNFEFR